MTHPFFFFKVSDVCYLYKQHHALSILLRRLNTQTPAFTFVDTLFPFILDTEEEQLHYLSIKSLERIPRPISCGGGLRLCISAQLLNIRQDIRTLQPGEIKMIFFCPLITPVDRCRKYNVSRQINVRHFYFSLILTSGFFLFSKYLSFSYCIFH